MEFTLKTFGLGQKGGPFSINEHEVVYSGRRLLIDEVCGITSRVKFVSETTHTSFVARITLFSKADSMVLDFKGTNSILGHRMREVPINQTAMPIQHDIWKVGASPEPLIVSKLAAEKELEDMITARPEMIQWGQASRINIRFDMITEDQLEQLAIQWHGSRRNIDPSPPCSYAGTRHRTLNIERRSEEERSLPPGRSQK